MDPINELIKHITRTRYGDLPHEAVEAAKKSVVDVIGAGIAGSSMPLGKMVATMVKDYDGKKQSSLLVYGGKVPQQEATFANVIMARVPELDDVHEGNKRRGGGIGGHSSVGIVPASLAMAEASPTPITGKRLILGIAVGVDLLLRIRLAGGQSSNIGWMATTVYPFGVVASAAKLFDLSEEVIANAMGAAYVHCVGNNLSTVDGTWDAWLCDGASARGGVVAVDLARRGHLGAKSPLLGNAGLYPLYFRNEYHEDILLSGLGKEFESANVSIKPYSCCKCAHHAIYTTLELVKKHQIKAERIESIRVRTCDYNMGIVVLDEKGQHKYAPQTVSGAQFSLPFLLALAIIKGAVSPDVLTEETLHDASILSLCRKVVAEATPEKNEITKNEGFPSADVEICTVDGKVYSGCEPIVKGHPDNPLTFSECAEKFRRCARLSAKPLSDKSIDKFLSQAEKLEEISDVRNMIGNLTYSLK